MNLDLDDKVYMKNKDKMGKVERTSSRRKRDEDEFKLEKVKLRDDDDNIHFYRRNENFPFLDVEDDVKDLVKVNSELEARMIRVISKQSTLDRIKNKIKRFLKFKWR